MSDRHDDSASPGRRDAEAPRQTTLSGDEAPLPGSVFRDLKLVDRILDTVGAVIVVLDAKGRIVDFNTAFQSALGYRLSEVKGKTIWDVFLIPEEVEAVRRVFKTLVNGDFPMTFQNYLVGKDGARRLYAWSNTCTVDEQGAVDHVIGTGIDITLIEKSYKDLVRTERDKRRILNRAFEAIMTIDLKRNVVDMNSSARAILGYGEGPLGDLRMEDIVGESSLADLDEREREIAELGYNPLPIEAEIRRKDGSQGYVMALAELLREEGRPSGFQIFAMDITERKLMEKALRVGQERYKAVFNGSHDIVLIANRDGTITDANRAMEEFAGLRKEDMARMHIWDFVHPDSRNVKKLRFEEVLERGATPPEEMRFILPDGETRIVESYGVRILGDRGDQAVQIIGRDITDKKQAEKEIESAKREAVTYLDLLLHDVANFCTPVLAYSEIIAADDDADDEVKANASRIVDRTKGIASLIARLRQLTLLSSARDSEEPIKKSITEAISSASMSVVSAHPDKTPEMDIRVPPCCSEVMVDARIEDVLEHVIDNAVKFNQSTTPRVEVTCARRMDKRASWTIEVGDYGIGIPDYRKKEIFRRAEDYWDLKRGLGLGLFIATSILEKMEGQIWAEDRVPGDHAKGAKIVITLPEEEVKG